MLIWFLLRIRPIYDNITVPNLDSSCLQPPLGKAGGFVGLVLKEAKSPVFLLVIRRTVDDDFPQTGCQLFELIFDIFPVFRFRNISYKQPRFGLANIYFQCFSLSEFVGIELFHCFVSRISGGESDESVSSVESGHGVHHQTQVPDCAALFEQRDQITLINVSWNLATKYFTAIARRFTFPTWWGSAKLSLPSGNVERISGSLQDFLDFGLVGSLDLGG